MVTDLTAPPAPSGSTARTGVDFSRTEEQELLVEQVRRFAEERIRPGVEARRRHGVRERDGEHRFPVEGLAEMGELGLLGMLVPEEYGGAGGDPLTDVL